MAGDIDFNDVLDDIFLSENKQCQESYEEGLKAGTEAGNPEGYHLGYHRGAELGRELGYYLGIVSYHLDNKDKQPESYSDKLLKQLEKSLFKYLGKTTMSSRIHKLHGQIDTVIAYLSPFLQLANCHMVEFLTDDHWNTLLPCKLREYLDRCDLNDAVEQFWRFAEGKYTDDNELSKWVQETRNHCLAVDNEYCLSTDQLQEHIRLWGGDVRSEVRISEFMNSKKSYEVLYEA
ncbi:jg15969 [Pararge aegeria aegeria]|uniref:Jg15969 protein n=1 Tax=Pararge aegeria aegeria TaxID=348720 RepID=A0A8S4R688_9NEOP|nr:jg15969 [Pararge aegeria aegeria]